MKISLNQQIVEVPENSTLYDILNDRQMIKPGIAVAVDNKVISRALWPDFKVAADAKITVISAVCGG